MPDRLRTFERVQFQGIWDADGTLVPRIIRNVVGRDVPERAFPGRLIELLGSEPHTPARTAIRDTLQRMGCLGEEPVPSLAGEA